VITKATAHFVLKHHFVFHLSNIRLCEIGKWDAQHFKVFL